MQASERAGVNGTGSENQAANGNAEANVNAIVEYFKGGIKDPSQPGRLGVELEHIIVGEGKCPVSYSACYGCYSRWKANTPKRWKALRATLSACLHRASP